MPTALPRSVRAQFGDEAANNFVRWIDQAVMERAVPRDEYWEVLSRLDVVENRLDGVEKEIAQQRQEVSELRREMNQHFAQMNEAIRVQTRWSIGILALFGTMTPVLLAIAVFGS